LETTPHPATGEGQEKVFWTYNSAKRREENRREENRREEKLLKPHHRAVCRGEILRRF